MNAWRLRGILSQCANDCVIQAVFCFHCPVTQPVLQFCPNCHVHSCILLISRRDVPFYATYMRNYGSLNYCYTLLVSDFKNTKSLIRPMYISFRGQLSDKVFTALPELPFEFHISSFLSRKAVKLLSRITFLFLNHCSTIAPHLLLPTIPPNQTRAKIATIIWLLL